MIKLSELKNARTGMSKPEYWRDVSTDIDINSCDARGLVATIKAAPDLIEFVEAWLRKEEAFKAAVTADMAFEDSASGPPSESGRLYDESKKRIAEMRDAQTRFDAAAKKVIL